MMLIRLSGLTAVRGFLTHARLRQQLLTGFKSGTLQERLEAQHQFLAAQLKEALEFKLLPRKVVNTETPVDKAVSLMDAFLEVDALPLVFQVLPRAQAQKFLCLSCCNHIVLDRSAAEDGAFFPLFWPAVEMRRAHRLKHRSACEADLCACPQWPGAP